jgi:8-oxo-dGTP pyrophosphatase MutT (NUDIX family)
MAAPNFHRLMGRLAERLDPATAEVEAPAGVREAAVALLLRPPRAEAEPGSALLIRRAHFPGDPWSGQVALPGGRTDAADQNLRETAIRETSEEIGVALDAAACLGMLPVVTPSHPGLPRVLVAPFVFVTGAETRPRPGEEVAEARWVPLPRLLRPDRTLYHPPGVPGTTGFPAIELGQDFVLWGLTLRIMDTFSHRWPEPDLPDV